MLDLLNCGKGKLDDPVVMSWALHRYEDARARSADLCHSMEEAWFDDLTLRRWIDAEDEEILATLFRVVPVQRFANVNSAVFERWRTWSGSLARHATPVLLGNPAKAVPLFAEHVQGKVQDANKTSAVIAALSGLPEPSGLELLRDATARVGDLEDEDFVKQILVETLLWPTVALDPGGLAALIRTYLHAWEDREDRVRRLLDAVCSATFGGRALFDNAVSLSAGESAQTFRSLRPLFNDGAPLEECDRILIETDPCPDAVDLLEKHRTTSAATTVAFSVIDAIRSMEGTGNSEMACFAVAAVLSAFERADSFVDDLSMEDVFDILTLDLSENRHFGTLTERLRSFDFRDIAVSVNERMPSIKDSWGGIHLANLVGELRLVDSIPILIDSLNRESGDFLCEAAQEALIRIGEPAQLALIARWGDLDFSQRIYGRGVLQQVGGRHTAEFAVEHFRKLFRDDVEGWCGLAEAAPDERSIDLLEPELRRKQPQIDETFYCLCMLAGRGHENFGDIRKRVMEKRRRDLERLSDFTSGKVPAVQDTVTLALKCERCGEVNRYEVSDIVVGGSGSTTPFFIGDEFPCASCGEWPDFELTTEAVMGLTATMMMLSAEEAAGHGRKGPLRLVDANYRWEQRPAPEVMAELKAAVAENPNSIEDHLRLGRLQYLFDRRRRAAECYSRVLELEPNSMEAELGLAHVMADSGSHQDAFDRLGTMLENKATWRFFRVDELPPAALGNEFAKLYNQLQTGLGVHDRPLLHTSFLENKRKVGRNDPCPCGSGKKYKKCCLR